MPDRFIDTLKGISPMVTALISAAVTFFGSLFIFKQKTRPEDRVDFQVLLKDYKEQVDLLRKEVESLRNQVMQLVQERDDCKQEIELLKVKYLED